MGANGTSITTTTIVLLDLESNRNIESQERTGDLAAKIALKRIEIADGPVLIARAVLLHDHEMIDTSD